MNAYILTPELLLQAYCSGAFPMAEHGGSAAPIHFYRPDERVLFTVRDFHLPRRFLRMLKKTEFTVKFPDDVRAIMQACGEHRDETWINPVLLDLYESLADHGWAAALGIYQDNVRVGGIYWVQVGSAVMAESMFSRVPDASKIALTALMAGIGARQKRLNLPGESDWVDVQFTNPHLEQFHPTTISAADYQSLVDEALDFSAGLSSGNLSAGFLSPDDFSTGALLSFLQSRTQIS